MPAAWFIDEATAADGPALCALAREVAMPGDLPVVFARDPDFFAALAVEGRERRVVLARRRADGRPFGYGVISTKPAWIDGRPGRIGYLGGLRLRPEGRGGRVLAAGYRQFRERMDPACDAYLTTILRANAAVRALLATPRATLPAYVPAGVFHCRAVAPLRRAVDAPPPGTATVPATPGDLPALFRFLGEEGPACQFFPRYEPGDLEPGGLLQGLRPGDIALLRRGDELIGCMGLWDQRAFRQTIVSAYPRRLRWLRPALNGVARCTGRPRLPRAGRPVRLAYAAVTCARGGDPALLAALFDDLRRRARGRFDLVVAGAHERHPFSGVLRRVPGIDFSSIVYRVQPAGGAAGAADAAADARPPYLETGAL